MQWLLREQCNSYNEHKIVSAVGFDFLLHNPCNRILHTTCCVASWFKLLVSIFTITLHTKYQSFTSKSSFCIEKNVVEKRHAHTLTFCYILYYIKREIMCFSNEKMYGLQISVKFTHLCYESLRVAHVFGIR